MLTSNAVALPYSQWFNWTDDSNVWIYFFLGHFTYFSQSKPTRLRIPTQEHCALLCLVWFGLLTVFIKIILTGKAGNTTLYNSGQIKPVEKISCHIWANSELVQGNSTSKTTIFHGPQVFSSVCMRISWQSYLPHINLVYSAFHLRSVLLTV